MKENSQIFNADFYLPDYLPLWVTLSLNWKKGKSVLVYTVLVLYNARLWIEETNGLVAIDTEISLNSKGFVAIEIATAVRKKSLAEAAITIWFFETPPPRRERELDR